MALTEKQAELDVSKWLSSEEAGHDMCGTYDFCVCCDKASENPCADAYEAFTKKAATPVKKTRTTKKAETAATTSEGAVASAPKKTGGRKKKVTE